MAIRTREELLNSVNTILGENNSDEALSFIEDITDTYDDLSNRNGDENWEERYNNLDKEWRERYRQRFNEPYNDDDDSNPEPKPLTFENLFKTEE